MSDFDFTGMFGPAYLELFAGALEEKADAEADLAWRLLGLEPGMEVLDLACGHGRIANRLAARGCRVTGLDVTPVFLDRARRDAAARGVAVEYVEGDMRSLPWEGRFDRVLNWFTAYGYFDDEDNRRVLAEVARALRPGGRFAVELNNRDWVLRHFEPVSYLEIDGVLMIDRRRLDPLTGRSVSERLLVRDGEVTRTPYFVRMFTFPELRDWLRAAGFGTVSGYGEDGEPLTIDSRRMITVAER